MTTSPSQRIGLVTCGAGKLVDYFPTAAEPDFVPTEPPFTPDDQLLVDELRRRGHQVSAVVWGAETSQLTEQFDRLIIRSPWDYQDSDEQRQGFLRWLEQLATTGVVVENEPPVMLWLMDKRYLLDFAAVGVPIVPTQLIPIGESFDLEPFTERHRGAVIKPAVSAAGAGLEFLPDCLTARAFQSEFTDRCQRVAQLVQPFLPEIQTNGEWSLVYFGGEYSHGVHKLPARGQIMVHAERGGSLRFADPPPVVRQLGDQTAAAVPRAFAHRDGRSCRMPLYLRIDVIETATGSLLSECEGVEPELFFRARPGSAVRFAEFIEIRTNHEETSAVQRVINRMKTIASFLILAWLLLATEATVCAQNVAGDVTVPKDVGAVLNKFCAECHGEQTHEAELRFDAIASIEKSARIEVMGKAQEQLAFGLMPPRDSSQPSAEQRQLVIDWFASELRKNNSPTLEDKLRLPSYGNRVDHAKLFSGEIKAKPFTPARRWLVSPQIFTERVFDVLKLDERERTGKRPAGMYGVTNPFTLPERSGVRDYDLTAVDGGHFLVMQTNASWIADRIIGTIRIKLGEPVEKVLENKADRWYPLRSEMYGKPKDSKSWAFGAFEVVMQKSSSPTDEELAAAIQLQFANVLQRPANETELQSYLGLMRTVIELGGNTEGLRKMLVAVLLESEFVYRLEFGAGEPDEFGRRMLSPREASYAIAYALGDKGPDATLVKAAEEGRLNSKDDYEREVKRLLADVTSFKGPVDPAYRNEHNDAYISTTHPKLVRFFREFFGYPLSLRVFKDIERSDGLYRVPDRGTNGTPGFLVVEADRVVTRIVEADREVFASLLTTDQFFVYHNLDNEKGEKLIEGWRKVYETLKNTNWKEDPEQVAKDHAALLQQHVAPGAMKGKGRGVHETDLSRIMTLFEVTFGRGGRPFTTVPWAHGNRFWHSPFYNLPRTPREGEYDRDAVFDYHPVQPFALPHRKGILTHPAWLIAHSQNSATDPIRRGKWIREKLLAGSVPDVPITVDAQIPEHADKTLRERLAAATSKQECWKCHQHMNPLGLAFEMYDDFGRHRTAESLEHPANLLAKGKAKYAADTYKTAPLISTGRLEGTGDATLDGDVTDALDMIDRLAKSDRARQSIIRHAFRFFLGRNELLRDSQTLIDADRAYVSSGGSFQAVVVSLLSSESIMYRK